MKTSIRFLYWEREIPCRLRDVLPGFTKDNLSAIRRHYAITGLSQLNKKDLARALSDRLPNCYYMTWLGLDSTRYQIMKRLEQKGMVSAEDLEPWQITYFQTRAVAFPAIVDEQWNLIAAKEAIESFAEWDSPANVTRVREHTEYVKLTKGLLYYFGALEIQNYYSIMEFYFPKFPESSILPLLESCFYDQEFFLGGGSLFSHLTSDPDWVIEEQEARPDLDYYQFTKKDLLQAASPHFVENTSQTRAFRHFLRENFAMSEEEITELIQDLLWEIRDEDSHMAPFEFINSALEFPSEEVLQTCLRLVQDLHNNTRQWILKGYTPNELFEQEKKHLKPLPGKTSPIGVDFQNRKRVGRNDPCPCGSGRKFKKCCGK